MVKIAVSGVGGRMGGRIAALALDDPKTYQVVGALEAPGHAALGQDLGQLLGRTTTQVVVTDHMPSALGEAQVLIEFTNPAATIDHARMAARHGVKLVIGTTGLTERQMRELPRLAKKIPILYAPNMSFGVYILRRALREVALCYQQLGPAALTIEMMETHHKMKKDKPSGTAKQLRDDLHAILVEHDIPIQSRREGEVVGEHTVTFTHGHDQLVLTHRATSRDTFAKGALFAARLLAMISKPKFYTMDLLWDAVNTTKKRLRSAA